MKTIININIPFFYNYKRPDIEVSGFISYRSRVCIFTAHVFDVLTVTIAQFLRPRKILYSVLKTLSGPR